MFFTLFKIRIQHGMCFSYELRKIYLVGQIRIQDEL